MAMKQYAITIDAELVKKVDEICKDLKLYNSRNEFFRDAIRCRVFEIYSVVKGEGEEDEEIMAEALVEEEEPEQGRAVH